MRLLRKYIRESLISEFYGKGLDKYSKPVKPDSKIILKLSKGAIAYYNYKALLREYRSAEKNIKSVGDTEKLKSFEKLKSKLENPIKYYQSLDSNASYFWYALELLTSKEHSGRVAARRIEFRNEVVVKVLDKLSDLGMKAAELAISELRKDPTGFYEKYKKVVNAVDTGVSIKNMLTGDDSDFQSEINRHVVYVVLGFAAKRKFSLLRRVAQIELIAKVIQGKMFIDDLNSYADQIIGKKEMGLKTQFIPSNIKDQSFEKGSREAAKILLDL